MSFSLVHDREHIYPIVGIVKAWLDLVVALCGGLVQTLQYHRGFGDVAHHGKYQQWLCPFVCEIAPWPRLAHVAGQRRWKKVLGGIGSRHLHRSIHRLAVEMQSGNFFYLVILQQAIADQKLPEKLFIPLSMRRQDELDTEASADFLSEKV